MPTDIRSYYLNGDNFHEAYASAHGLNQILALKPDAIAIEPTGVNYTRLRVRKMSEAGVKIALIGHSQLRSYRKNLQLPDIVSWNQRVSYSVPSFINNHYLLIITTVKIESQFC